MWCIAVYSALNKFCELYTFTYQKSLIYIPLFHIFNSWTLAFSVSLNRLNKHCANSHVSTFFLEKSIFCFAVIDLLYETCHHTAFLKPTNPFLISPLIQEDFIALLFLLLWKFLIHPSERSWFNLYLLRIMLITDELFTMIG